MEAFSPHNRHPCGNLCPEQISQDAIEKPGFPRAVDVDPEDGNGHGTDDIGEEKRDLEEPPALIRDGWCKQRRAPSVRMNAPGTNIR